MTQARDGGGVVPAERTVFVGAEVGKSFATT